jgi:hypothetical protein
MKKITLLALFTLTLFTITFGASSSKNTAQKDLSFLTQSFTSKLFDTIPQSSITIVTMDYSGDVTFNTPPSTTYSTVQVTPYSSVSRNSSLLGPTTVTFTNNSTLPFYVAVSQPGWYSWSQITAEGGQVSFYSSSVFPTTIKIGTDLSLIFPVF